MLDLLTSVNTNVTYSCGPGDFQFEGIIPKIVSTIITVIKIGVPVLLIIVGMIDFGKSVVAQDDRTMKKNQSLFVRRLISALLVFLVVLVVQIAVRFIAGKDNDNIMSCVNCFINGTTEDCKPHSYSSSSSSDEPEEIDEEPEEEYIILENLPVRGIVVQTYGAANTDDSGLYFVSSEPNASAAVQSGRAVIINGKMYNDMSTIRKDIVSFAQSIYYNRSSWVYLKPAERNEKNITYLKNVGNVSGGDCLTKTYNGEMCLTINGSKYYGTDCNGFVAYVYHSVLGFSNTTNYKFFTPNNKTMYWYLDEGNAEDDYFTIKKYTNINILADDAEPGDAVARICPNDKTHIGIYYGKVNGQHTIIDNSGWTSADKRFDPITKRSIIEFIDEYSGCKYTLFKLKDFFE